MNDNKIRIYDLAKELKQDTKRVMEELRREGIDVSVASNSVSKELADKIRSKYFPKKETVPTRAIKVIHRIPSVENPINNLPLVANKTNTFESQIKRIEPSIEPGRVEFKELPVEPLKLSQKDNSNDIADISLKVDCRECLRQTKHSLIHSTNVPSAEWNEEYQIVQCMGCESLSFRRILLKNQSNNIEEIDLYPSRIKGRQKLKIESIPPTIAQIYEEVRLALSNKLPIVATTGMRTLIELVCDDQNSKARNLKDKIDDLVTMQLLTIKNAKNLHKLRDFGNNAAHRANIPSEDTLDKCIDAIEHLLKDIYLPEISN